MNIPAIGNDRALRNVLLGDTGYRLFTWDTYRTDRYGKSVLGYAFYEPGKDMPLFSGEDFHCAPGFPIDSDKALRSLLGFLTLKPGDTDPEFFADYTEEQRAFCERDAEQLQQWGFESCDVDDPEEWEAYCCFRDVEEGS